MVGTTRNQTYADNADDLTYNPQASALHDDAAFNDDGDFESAQPLGARGADNQPTNRNFAREDKETERSEQLGQIPRSEVNDLLGSATQEEKKASGRTRGNKVDAYKQEKEMDDAYEATGIADAEPDVEISKASGV